MRKVKVLRATFVLIEGGVVSSPVVYFENRNSPETITEIKKLEDELVSMQTAKRREYGESVFRLEVKLMAWQEMKLDKEGFFEANSLRVEFELPIAEDDLDGGDIRDDQLQEMEDVTPDQLKTLTNIKGIEREVD